MAEQAAQAIKQMTRNFNMKGNGAQTFQVASGYKFVTVLNSVTPKTIEFFEGQHSAEATVSMDAYFVVQPYTNITFPIKEQQYYTIVYRGEDTANKLIVIFTSENLGINFAGDIVGLARKEQFPSYLYGDGVAKYDAQLGTIVQGQRVGVHAHDYSPGVAFGTQSATSNYTQITLPWTVSFNDTCEVLIQADPANTADVLLGDFFGQNFHLRPGDTLSLPIKGDGSNETSSPSWQFGFRSADDTSVTINTIWRLIWGEANKWTKGD